MSPKELGEKFYVFSTSYFLTDVRNDKAEFYALSEKDLQDNSRAILLHESTHIRLHHSYDLIIAEVCIILQWFNPAAWLLKQELQTVHEYDFPATEL